MSQASHEHALSLGDRVDERIRSRGEGKAGDKHPALLRLCVTLLLALCAALSPLAHAATIPHSDYRAKLQQIADAIERDDLSAINDVAIFLDGKKVASPSGTFEADPSLLSPLKNLNAPGELARFKPRLKRLLDALPETDAAAPPKTPAIELNSVEALERLRRDEAINMPQKDGEISGDEIVDSAYYTTIRDALKRAINWIDETADWLFKWLRSFFPKDADATGPAGISTLIIKIAVVLFAVTAIAIVVYILMRRNAWNSRPMTALVSAPVASSKDADPTSRNTSEWENYAAQLAASGRHREAIRACYHAVLTSFFRAGFLHYRKGRTNWEYCYALPLNISWRDRFFELTGFFEVEWYGKTRSEPEDFNTYASAVRQLLALARNGTEVAA